MGVKRYDFLDVAKGIGMLLVIVAHINYTPSLLITIYSFHMPLFFFLSGMVFDSRKYDNFSKFMKRKSQTLLCPYVLFYVLSVLYYLGIDIVANLGNLDLDKYFTYFVQMFLSQGSAKLPNAPLWFVPCLFLVEIMYYWISKLKRSLMVPIVILLTSLGWFLESDILPIKNELSPLSIDSALFAIGFFALGNFSFKVICDVSEKLKNHRLKNLLCVIEFFVAVTVLIPFALYNGKVSLGSKVLGNGLIFYITGVLGVCVVLSLSILFEKSKILKYCGRNSFKIMAIHCLIRESIRLVYKFLDVPMYDKTVLHETILPIIIVIIASILFAMLYNKIQSLLVQLRKSKSLNA